MGTQSRWNSKLNLQYYLLSIGSYIRTCQIQHHIHFYGLFCEYCTEVICYLSGTQFHFVLLTWFPHPFSHQWHLKMDIVFFQSVINSLFKNSDSPSIWLSWCKINCGCSYIYLSSPLQFIQANIYSPILTFPQKQSPL